MTITESRPSELIRIKLEFVRPMEDTANVEFHFKEKDNQTEVTWNMSGQNNFMEKAFCLFMNLDKMIGDKYEEGAGELAIGGGGEEGGRKVNNEPRPCVGK